MILKLFLLHLLNMAKYSDLSYALTKKLKKSDKQKDGIYFTPPETVVKNLKYLKTFMPKIKTVLEPSCGSGEYITHLDKTYKNRTITGLELNKIIYESIKIHKKNNIKIFNDSFLKHTESYDLILGNPPYFVMKKCDVDPSYYKYFDGRPNIFILFIIKSLKLLNKNGILSFVLPKKFLNCSYYEKTREYINKKFKIINIIECVDRYIETQQETIIMIIQNKKDNNSKFILDNSKFTIFGLPENIIKLNELCKQSETLFEKNFTVNVGNIVWNQEKDKLFNDKDIEKSSNEDLYKEDIETLCNNKLNKEDIEKLCQNKFDKEDIVKLCKNKLDNEDIEKLCKILHLIGNRLKFDEKYGDKKAKLIYSGNIVSNKLTDTIFKNTQKKKYMVIKKEDKKQPKIMVEPILLINRGYGAGNYKLNYCLIEGGFEYLVENHLICIKYTKKITKHNLINLYKEIIKSFENVKTQEFINLYCSNNINTTELCEILPIYKD